jgi:hypothetical protein
MSVVVESARQQPDWIDNQVDHAHQTFAGWSSPHRPVFSLLVASYLLVHDEGLSIEGLHRSWFRWVYP